MGQGLYLQYRDIDMFTMGMYLNTHRHMTLLENSQDLLWLFYTPEGLTMNILI